MPNNNFYLVLTQFKLGIDFIKHLLPQCLELPSKNHKNENICILGNLIGYQEITYRTIIEILLL